MRYDNPAARLKAILEVGLKANINQQCLAVWRELLEAAPNDNDDLFARLGKVMELPREILFLLQAHFPHQVESSSLWRNPIESAFMTQQLGGKWESFSQHINAYCVPQLALVADLLHSKVGAQVARAEEVANLVDRLTTLIAEVEGSTLSRNLKIYLLRELSALLQTLREYKITGAEAALKQAESMIGHAHRDHEYFAFLKDHELGQRVLDNLNAVAAVLTVYLSLPQLAQTAFTLLPK